MISFSAEANVTTASVMESGSIPTENLISIWVGNRYEVWGFRKETVEYFLQVVKAARRFSQIGHAERFKLLH